MPLFGRRRQPSPTIDEVLAPPREAHYEPPHDPDYVPSWPVGGAPTRTGLPEMPEPMVYLNGAGAHPDESQKLLIRETEYSYVNRDREELRDVLKRVIYRLESTWVIGTYEEKALLREAKNAIRLSEGHGILPDVKPFYPLGKDPRVLDHLGRPIGTAGQDGGDGAPVELIISTSPTTSGTSAASGRWRDPRSRNDRSVRREQTSHTALAG